MRVDKLPKQYVDVLKANPLEMIDQEETSYTQLLEQVREQSENVGREPIFSVEEIAMSPEQLI